MATYMIVYMEYGKHFEIFFDFHYQLYLLKIMTFT